MVIDGECLLMSDRLHHPLRFDRPFVDSAGKGVQVTTIRAAKCGGNRCLRQTGEVADGLDAEPGQPFERLRPDSPEGPHRVRMEEGQLVSRRDRHHARRNPSRAGDRRGRTIAGQRSRDRRFGRLAGQLGQQLARRNADRARQPELVEHPAAHGYRDFGTCAEEAQGTGQIEERLVERDPLDDGRECVENFVDSLAVRTVEGVVAAHEDGVGAQPASPYG